MNRSSTFVTALNVQKSRAIKVSFCESQIVPFRKANSITNSKHTLPSLINTSRMINHGDFLRFFHKTTNFMLARQWLNNDSVLPSGVPLRHHFAPFDFHGGNYFRRYFLSFYGILFVQLHVWYIYFPSTAKCLNQVHNEIHRQKNMESP